jgi:predicted metal-binding protein
LRPRVRTSTLHQLDSHWMQTARLLGATAATVIPVAEISAEESLAEMCKTCGNHGLGSNCPPHVSGPQSFRELASSFERALVFRLDVPTEVLMSAERIEAFALLQQIATGIELGAKQRGFDNATAFAGGSCRQIFCADEPECAVLEGRDCLHPDKARASMSGFGINVAKLMKSAVWAFDQIDASTDPDAMPTSQLVGLVLLA